MVAERGLQGQWEGEFIVDLIISVNCFKFSPSVLSGKGMPAQGKRNSHCEVVGTPRIFHNKGIQRFRRLALDADPLPESPALKDSSASGAGWLVSHMGDTGVRLRIEGMDQRGILGPCLGLGLYPVPGKEGEQGVQGQESHPQLLLFL